MMRGLARNRNGDGTRRAIDVLIVSPGVTIGLRGDAERLARSLRTLGYSVELVFLRDEVTWAAPSWLPNAAGELLVAAVLRRKTKRLLLEIEARTLVYGTSISTIFQPRRCLARAAVRIDQPASVNRLGFQNAPQRWLEKRQLPRARLLLPWSPLAVEDLHARYRVPVVPCPPPIPRGPTGGRRRRRAVCYAVNPEKKGLDLLVNGWRAAEVSDAELLVTGIDAEAAREFLHGRGIEVPPGIRWCGRLARGEYRRLVAESTVFVSAARKEEYGVALLEALADGALLVALPMPWRIEAYELARTLDPDLAPGGRSPEALSAAIRAAFDYSESDRAAYAARARSALEAYSVGAWQRRLRDEVMPALVGDGSPDRRGQR